MAAPFLTIKTRSPEDTSRLASRLANLLAPGDCLLLDGPIGAGKTHLARHLIQSLQEEPEDVPSPTFTLVQMYDTRAGELWHADLYRLTALSEIEELGLVDAFETAICLVEWPDRLGDLRPTDALTLRFAADPKEEETRIISFEGNTERWAHLKKVLNDD